MTGFFIIIILLLLLFFFLAGESVGTIGYFMPLLRWAGGLLHLIKIMGIGYAKYESTCRKKALFKGQGVAKKTGYFITKVLFVFFLFVILLTKKYASI